MSQYDFAKLRPIDVKPLYHQNQPVFFLRDPLQLSSHTALVPQYFGPILAECDGTQTLTEVQKKAGAKMGISISLDDVEHLLKQLDEIYLLDNERSAKVKAKVVVDYRKTPFRPPALAGISYPAKVNELQRDFEQLMADTTATPELEAGAGLFSPHIDYPRGGPVYAQTWKRSAKLAREAECVVIFGTDHNSWLPGQITPTRQNYATPFGVLPTDQKVVDALVDVLGEQAAFEEEIHHRQEHAIELVITWLHYVRQGQSCPVIPILCGSFHHFIADKINPANDITMNEVIAAIKSTTANRKVLAVASGDLAHLGPYFNTKAVDATGKAKIKTDDDAMLATLSTGNPENFFEGIRTERGKRNVCGTAPFYLTLKLMGEVTGEITAYNCCPVPGDEESFVSICGMVFS